VYASQPGVRSSDSSSAAWQLRRFRSVPRRRRPRTRAASSKPRCFRQARRRLSSTATWAIAAWKFAAVADTFVDADTGRVYADQTEAFLLYDKQYIYVAFHCRDSRPEGIVARETVRDSEMYQDDTVQITLDPYLTRKYNDYAIFTVNSPGNARDADRGRQGEQGRVAGRLVCRRERVPDGWTAEMRIPWAILNYPNRRGPGRMGINFRRRHGRLKLETMWSDLGQQRFNERDGSWLGVEAPQRAWKPRFSMLPYIQPIAGASSRVGESTPGWTSIPAHLRSHGRRDAQSGFHECRGRGREHRVFSQRAVCPRASSFLPGGRRFPEPWPGVPDRAVLRFAADS